MADYIGTATGQQIDALPGKVSQLELKVGELDGYEKIDTSTVVETTYTTNSYVLNRQGGLVSAEGSSVGISDYIEIIDKLKIYGRCPNVQYPMYCLYDADKNFVSYYVPSSIGNAEITVTKPDNATYIRYQAPYNDIRDVLSIVTSYYTSQNAKNEINTLNATTSSLTTSVNTVLAENAVISANSKDIIEEDYETTAEAGFLHNNGTTIISATTRSYSDYIELGESISFVAFDPAGAYAQYIYYNADKVKVGSKAGTGTYSEVNVSLQRSNYPTGAVYIRFTQPTNISTAAYTAKYYKPLKYILNKEIEAANKARALQSKLFGDKLILTSVGSSAFDVMSGGQWRLTDAQKTAYGVTSDLTITKVLQTLLGYDVANVCAYGGRTSSAIAFMNGLGSFKYNKSITLKKDKSWVTLDWTLDSVSAPMTSGCTHLYRITQTDAIFGGYSVLLDGYNKRVKLNQDVANDITLPSGSMIYGKPKTRAYSANDGVVQQGIKNSTGLIVQYGGNAEGATADELIKYAELTIKASGCRWFILVPANSDGCDLYTHTDALKAHFGGRFIDYQDYLCTIQAIRDQGLTPTTSADYPDEDGINSNPLTATQIANNVPCDFAQVAQKKIPSSFWHSAYRDGEEQTINQGHLNAQGLECVGKYLYKVITMLDLA